MKVNDVRTLGSLATSTYFKNDKKETIKVEVRIHTYCTISNLTTTFSYHMYLRKYKGRKFHYLFSSENLRDVDKISKWINEQSLYIAFHNHWNNINPLKVFSSQYSNGNTPFYFSVKPAIPDKPSEIKTLYSVY